LLPTSFLFRPATIRSSPTTKSAFRRDTTPIYMIGIEPVEQRIPMRGGDRLRARAGWD
jgi:hypothetical protein